MQIHCLSVPYFSVFPLSQAQRWPSEGHWAKGSAGSSGTQRAEERQDSGVSSPRPTAPSLCPGHEGATELRPPGGGAQTRSLSAVRWGWGIVWGVLLTPPPGRQAHLHGPASAQSLVAAARGRD